MRMLRRTLHQVLFIQRGHIDPAQDRVSKQHLTAGGV